MANSFEEEMTFVFEEEQEEHVSDNDTATSAEINEYLYCGDTKYYVC